MIRKFFKTNIFIVAYTLVSPTKVSTAASATKMQFGGILSSFVALAEVTFFGLTKV